MIKFCAKCGKKVSEDDVICIKCGTYLKPIAKNAKEWSQEISNKIINEEQEGNSTTSATTGYYRPTTKPSLFSFIGAIVKIIVVLAVIGGLVYIFLFNNSAEKTANDICNGFFIRKNFTSIKKHFPKLVRELYTEEKYNTEFNELQGKYQKSKCELIKIIDVELDKDNNLYKLLYEENVTQIKTAYYKIHTSSDSEDDKQIMVEFALGKIGNKWYFFGSNIR